MLELLKFSYKMGVVQMNCCCKKSDLSLIKPVLDEYGDIKGSLITVLQQAQDIYGYLPTDVLYCIAERIGVSPAKVMGVATFYSQFRLKPVGKYLIMLCQGTACHVNGSEMIEEAVNQTLNQGILTRDLGGQASTAEMTAAIIRNL